MRANFNVKNRCFLDFLNTHGKLNRELLGHSFSFLKQLRGVPQEPKYHAEGDVETHTWLVAEALIQLEEWATLSPLAQQILLTASFYHDIGKAVCTKITEDGAITSHGHARIGALMSRAHLWQESTLAIPFQVREIIVALVRYHGLPIWFLEKESPEREIHKASQLIPLHLLSLLAEADVRGRICADQSELLEKIELFRLFCQEHNCYDKPKSFPDAHTRFLYFQNQWQTPDYSAYDQTEFPVYMLSGLPGAGKDTWIKKNLINLPVISLDEIRKKLGISPKGKQGVVIHHAKEQARIYLRKKQSFVWNATNITRLVREPLIDLFTSYRAKVQIIYIEPSSQTLLQQNQQREDVVPFKAIQHMVRKLEVPQVTEAHEIQWIITGERVYSQRESFYSMI